MKPIRVLLVTNIISPYRIPLFNRLHEAGELAFKVLCLAEKEKNREWQVAKERIRFDYQILPGWHSFVWDRELAIHLNWGLWRELRRYKPDVVITSGYDTLAYWEAFLYCKVFKKKYILWNGSTLLSVGTTRGLVGKMKRWIIKGADRYITYGTKAAEYLEYMGAPKERIHVGINTVDMDWYRRRVNEIRGTESFDRECLKYPKSLMLYVGRLPEGKGVKLVLKALQSLHDPDSGLLVVGSGPQEEELKRFCQSQNLHNIYFEGFHQQEDLPYYYALADVFIFPSLREVWGLVVNEALASGLYVLCSDRTGSAYDLILESWNGALFDPYNMEELTALIRRTKENVEEIRTRRKAISKHACREFSIERSVKAFLDAVEGTRDNDNAPRPLTD